MACGWGTGSAISVWRLDASTLDPDVKRQTIRATANLRFDESVFGEQITIDPGRSVAVDIPRITVPTTATVAALAMVRVPIGAAAGRPQGRIATYAFAGPVYLVTDSDISGDWGLRAGGGVKLPLTRNLRCSASIVTRASPPMRWPDGSAAR